MAATGESWPLTPDLTYTEKLPIWQIFNFQNGRGRFLHVAEVCCAQVWLLPPVRDWGKGTGAAPWGLGWALQPRPVPLPQPGSRAGGGVAVEGSPLSPQLSWCLWRGQGYGLAGKPIFDPTLRGPAAPFGVGRGASACRASARETQPGHAWDSSQGWRWAPARRLGMRTIRVRVCAH